MLSKRSVLKSFLLGLATLALPVWADGAATVPEGSVVLHYHRADGNYTGWGVHAWKRTPGSSDQPLDGISWFSPLTPNGTDDFGPYWIMKIADFGKTGIAHYIIHKGDSKEQRGGDKEFDTATQKEAWVVSGDEHIYSSKEAALAAVPK